MARAKKPYSVNPKKMLLTRYNGEKTTAQDDEDILNYIKAGYIVKWVDRGLSIEDMRVDMAKDEKALAKFNDLYKAEPIINAKGKKEIGFHRAVKFYNEWKKAQK